MANILELMGLVTPQAEAETVPALKKALGFNMMDEVKAADPVTKKLDNKVGSEGTLVTQNRIQAALSKPKVVSQAANEQAVQNVSDVRSELGLGNADSTSEIDSIVKSLKDRLAKVGETSQAAKDNQLNYQVGALVTKNPLLQQLAQRGVASADEQTTGLQAKLLDALKTKSGIKKDEDAKVTELYKNQLLEKYMKNQGAGSGGVSPRELAVAASKEKSLLTDKQINGFDDVDQQIVKAQDILKDKTLTITPELFSDLEKDFQFALTNARSSTGAERDEQSIHAMEKSYSRLKQLLTSKPDNVGLEKHKENISKAMSNLAKTMHESKGKRIDVLLAGIEGYPSDTIKNVVKAAADKSRNTQYADPNYVYGAQKQVPVLSREEWIKAGKPKAGQ